MPTFQTLPITTTDMTVVHEAPINIDAINVLTPVTENGQYIEGSMARSELHFDGGALYSTVIHHELAETLGMVPINVMKKKDDDDENPTAETVYVHAENVQFMTPHKDDQFYTVHLTDGWVLATNMTFGELIEQLEAPNYDAVVKHEVPQPELNLVENKEAGDGEEPVVN